MQIGSKNGITKINRGYHLIDRSGSQEQDNVYHSHRPSSRSSRKLRETRKGSKSRENSMNQNPITTKDVRSSLKRIGNEYSTPRTLTFNSKHSKEVRSVPQKTKLDELLGLNSIDQCIEAFKNPSSNYLLDNHEESIWSSTTGLLNQNSPANDEINLHQAKCIRSIADMLLCPQTVLPIIIGLFNRSGSTARDVYFERLSTELKAINAIQTLKTANETRKFQLNWLIIFLPISLTLIISYIFSLVINWKLGLAVGFTAIIFYCVLIVFLFIGTSLKRWERAMSLSETLKRYSQTWQLLFDILFYKVPEAPTDAKSVKLLPITLNLSSLNSAWDGMLMLSDKLTSASEIRYNKLIYRLQWASEDAYSDKRRTYRFACCLPIWTWVFVNTISFLFLLFEWITSIKDPSSKVYFNQMFPNIFANTTQPMNNDIILKKVYLASLIISSLCFGLSGIILLLVIIIPLKNLIYGRRKLNSLRNMHYNDDHPEKSFFMNESPNIMRSCNPSTTASTVNEILLWSGNGINNDINHHHGKNSKESRSRTKSQSGGHYSKSQYRSAQKDIESAATLAAAAAAAAVTATNSRFNNLVNDTQSSISLNSKQEYQVQKPKKSKKNHKKSLDKMKKFKKSLDKVKKQKIEFYDQNSDLNEDSLLDSDFEVDHNKKKPSQLTPEEISLRYYLMRTCGVLHKLDARLGDRQTRIIICVDGTSANTNGSASQKKLASFVRLLDRLLMSTTPYSSSGEVPVLLNSPQCPGIKLFSTSWTPSVVVLLMGTETTPWKPANEENSSVQFPILNPASKTGYSGFSEAWRYIHQTCHLPIYLEEAPPGPDELSFVEWCQNNSVRSIEEYLLKNKLMLSNSRKGRKSRTDQQTIQFQQSNQEKSLLDFFLVQNELTDLNSKKLRYLVTLTEFLGRMLRLNRLIPGNMQKPSLNSPQISSHNSSDNILLSNNSIEPLSTSVIVTWLSLCVHWPFLTSWLVLFFEEHWSILAKEDDAISFETSTLGSNTHIGGLRTSSNRSSRERNLNNQNGDLETNSLTNVTSIQPIRPTDKLSDLYKRVLAKLSQGVRSSRYHLNSISLGNISSMSPNLMNESDSYQNFMSKILYEMSLRDVDPARLESYLRPTNSKRTSSREFAGNLRAGQLVQVMNSSPFLNPQIRRWIREILRTKGFAISKSLAKERELARNLSRRSMNQVGRNSKMDEYFEEEFNKAVSSRLNLTECVVKLKNGMPNKNLSEMTVNEICGLIHEIEGFAEDSLSGQISSLRVFYENRIRQLNISGTVLAVCDFNDLRAELEMSFGDWHLFSSLITFLKTQEMKQREKNNLNKSTMSLDHLNKERDLINPYNDIVLTQSSIDIPRDMSNVYNRPNRFDEVIQIETSPHEDTGDGELEFSTESPCNCEYWYSIDKEKSPVQRQDRSCSPKSPLNSQSDSDDSFTCYLDSDKSSISSSGNNNNLNNFEYEINTQMSPSRSDKQQKMNTNNETNTIPFILSNN